MNNAILCLVIHLVQLIGLLRGNYEYLTADHDDLASLWEQFKSENSKSYDNAAEEETRSAESFFYLVTWATESNFLLKQKVPDMSGKLPIHIEA